MKEDISIGEIEVIYKQMANFQLQLFMLDFDRIGSLSSPRAEAQDSTPQRFNSIQFYSPPYTYGAQ